MSTKKTSSRALSHKIEATAILNSIERLRPRMKITLRWCPGHEGVGGNEEVYKLATAAAKQPLQKSHTDRPTFTSFRAAVKEWAEEALIEQYTPQDIKRLGHLPQPRQHQKALDNLKNKHSISSITQLRSGHIPLFQYLHKRNLRTDPTCVCGTGIENVEHFLLLCPLHEEVRQDLLRELSDLDITLNRKALNHPAALEPIANYASSTWRLRSRWEWAEIHNEATPKDKQRPD